jgi:hypothetical protein
MKCSKCGVEGRGAFCSTCGTPLVSEPQPVPIVHSVSGVTEPVAGEPLRLSLRWPHVPESLLGEPRFSAVVAGLLGAAWGVVVYSAQLAVAGPWLLYLLISTVGLALIVSRVRRLDIRTVCALVGGAVAAPVVYAGVVYPFWMRALGWFGSTPEMPPFYVILTGAGKPFLGIALAALFSARLRADLRNLAAPTSPSLEMSRVLPLAGGALLGALCLVYALANWPSFATPQSYTAPNAPVISKEDQAARTAAVFAAKACQFSFDAVDLSQLVVVSGGVQIPYVSPTGQHVAVVSWDPTSADEYPQVDSCG